MKKTVFIDGSAGTTGLKIYDRLKNREDINLLTLSEENRKDINARKCAINSSDITFLCLPDVAAVEAVSLIDNDKTVIIDTSTAHRTESGWTYGFPELSKMQENNIKNSKRIAVPGCHASGFIALVYPLIENGIISTKTLLTCHSITGYSGGGKKMIAEYEDKNRADFYSSPRQYGITQNHKHLKEMRAITGLENSPIFCPIVSDYYSGMVVTVPIFRQQLNNGFNIDIIKKIYKEKYYTDMVKYTDNIDENGLIASSTLSGNDDMKVTVSGNDDRILLIAQYDNLGKGASGAAIECMNISIGANKYDGLIF